MAKAKSPSGEATLPLGDEPVLDAAKAAEDAELAAMLAEEEKAKADAEAQAKADADAAHKAELEALAEQDRLDHEAAKAETTAKLAAEEAERLAAEEASRANEAAQKPAHGPRVKVWPHGSVDWDAAHYEANLEFTVDTEKHTEEAFLGLLASGALIRLD